MIEFLRAPAAILFVFGLVIFIHELGHFVAAKLMGVYAPRFSIGFGPALWSRKWGETEYMLAAIPLGGYVRMASKEDESMAFIEGGSEAPTEPTELKKPRFWNENGVAPFGPHPVPADRWFESKGFIARLFILMAGVTMNILLGFALFVGMTYGFGRPVLFTHVVGSVAPVAEAPQLASLAAGDTIVAVGAVRVTRWNDIDFAIDTLAGDTVSIRTQRGVVTVPVGAAKGAQRIAVIQAIQPAYGPVLVIAQPGGPADRAGFQSGDSVTVADGVAVSTWQDVKNRIEPAAGREITLEIVRGTVKMSVKVRPDSATQPDPATKKDVVVGKIGVLPQEPDTREDLSFVESVKDGAQQTWFAAGLVARTLGSLATKLSTWKQIGGPVMIGGAAAQAAKMGWEPLLRLLALISINVAVFNLLPVPVLDGGQIMLLAAEKVKGGAVSLRTREYLMRAGLAMILALLIVVMANDLPRLWHQLVKP